MTTYTWNATTLSADWTDPNEWSAGGAPSDAFPGPGDAAEIGAGTVELDVAQLFNIAVTLFTTYNVEIVAANVDLGDRTQLLTASVPSHFGSLVYDVVGSGWLDDTNRSPGQPSHPGTIDFAAAPLTIELSAASTIDTTATFTNEGVVSGGALFLAAAVDTTNATFINNATIDVTGPLSLAAGVTLAGNGTVDLDEFAASVRLDGAVGAGQTFRSINVAPDAIATNTLTIATIAQFQGTIDLTEESQIVLPGMVSDMQSYADGVLTFANGAKLDVVPVQDANSISVYTVPVTFSGPGQTVVLAVHVTPCFCAGTHITTSIGAVPVEELPVGATLRLARGGTAEVVWVGRRDVRCDRHPRPHDVWPVRILADAVAPGVPLRDLLLSPDHAVLIGGHLTPVRHLANGATVVQEPVAVARYHHIELARHDLLLAEGLAAESYLDTGNRTAFVGGAPALALLPNFSRRVWATAGCAPLVEDGPSLTLVRLALLRRAAQLGHHRTHDPALRLLANGRMLRPHADFSGWQVLLPTGTNELRLCSRAWVPAEMNPAEGDRRRLGVAIGQLWLNRRPVSLDSPALCHGWHATEPHWRWTDGNATIAVGGARTIGFTLAMTGKYWRRSHATGALRKTA